MFFSAQYIEYIKFSLLGLFVVVSIVQLLYYYVLYIRVASYKRAPNMKKHPISVIICARNEAENLRNNLPEILEQEHDDFEVVVVNDCSSDETENVLGILLKKYSHLKVTNINPDNKFTHGKKLAVTVGIKAAKNEWLVFTDADCKPVSRKWLKRLQENFNDKTDIVLGIGKYEKRKGFLNAYIRYDTLIIAMQYISFALARMPYMGVGRNLAYRKSLFFENKGFASHYGLQSGDDDLFVNETATKQNVAVEFHPESYTISVPKNTWFDWKTQKKRHISTADRYKSNHIFWLGLEPLTRFVFYVTFCLLIGLNLFTIVVLSVFGIRMVTQLVIIKLTMQRFREQRLLLWVIIFDLISLFINFNIYLSGKFGRKKSRWK